MIKLYDFFMVGFPYEADVLYIKLLEEYEHIERFYIVETDATHQGNPKPYYWGEILAEPRFQSFRDKVIYEAVASAELGFVDAKTPADAQHNEHAQRDWLYRKHGDEIADDDLIWVSDADELLGGEDIPKILLAFESFERLRAVHVPLLRSVYDYAYVDEQRGYWPTVALRKRAIDEFYGGSLSAVRATFYRQVRVPSIIQTARPTRYHNEIVTDQVSEIIGKALRQNTIYGSLRHIPNSNLAGLLVDPRLAGYYGWHFSCCYKNPIDMFRKGRALWHSHIGQPENIVETLLIMNLRLAGEGPIVPPKPFLKKWPLTARLFPLELVDNQASYLTGARGKVAALTEEQILEALDGPNHSGN